LQNYVGSGRFGSLDADLAGLIAELDSVKIRRSDQLYPHVFADLARFCSTYKDHLDPTLARFDREVQFYLGYLSFIASLKQAGLPFCYPEVEPDTKQVNCVDDFDLALAAKQVTAQALVVCNSFQLDGQERIFVVSGPNQGGKTTFARTFGQLHHLASLGLPVPGREARLSLPDAIYTHFEREENIATLHGKLEDDLVRMHAILERVTPLAGKVMKRIIAAGCLCVCVTFLDELASLSDTVVSMMSTVDPDEPTVRTYKVVRKTADGSAYAISLARKYRLTFDQLRERIPASLSSDAALDAKKVHAS
jgi:DNA mismatch repair protein MutS